MVKYLTKNGFGAMVVLSLEEYASFVDNVEIKLNEADKIAETSEERLSQDDVFRSEECGKEVSRSVFTKENRYEAINI